MLAEIESEAPTYVRIISEIDIADRNNLKIILVDDTAEIYLGKEDYASRLRGLMNSRLYRELKEKNRNISVVDLRFDDKIYFQFSHTVLESSRKGGPLNGDN